MISNKENEFQYGAKKEVRNETFKEINDPNKRKQFTRRELLDRFRLKKKGLSTVSSKQNEMAMDGTMATTKKTNSGINRTISTNNKKTESGLSRFIASKRKANSGINGTILPSTTKKTESGLNETISAAKKTNSGLSETISATKKTNSGLSETISAAKKTNSGYNETILSSNKKIDHSILNTNGFSSAKNSRFTNGFSNSKKIDLDFDEISSSAKKIDSDFNEVLNSAKKTNAFFSATSSSKNTMLNGKSNLQSENTPLNPASSSQNPHSMLNEPFSSRKAYSFFEKSSSSFQNQSYDKPVVSSKVSQSLDNRESRQITGSSLLDSEIQENESHFMKRRQQLPWKPNVVDTFHTPMQKKTKSETEDFFQRLQASSTLKNSTKKLFHEDDVKTASTKKLFPEDHVKTASTKKLFHEDHVKTASSKKLFPEDHVKTSSTFATSASTSATSAFSSTRKLFHEDMKFGEEMNFTPSNKYSTKKPTTTTTTNLFTTKTNINKPIITTKDNFSFVEKEESLKYNEPTLNEPTLNDQMDHLNLNTLDSSSLVSRLQEAMYLSQFSKVGAFELLLDMERTQSQASSKAVFWATRIRIEVNHNNLEQAERWFQQGQSVLKEDVEKRILELCYKDITAASLTKHQQNPRNEYGQAKLSMDESFHTPCTDKSKPHHPHESLIKSSPGAALLRRYLTFNDDASDDECDATEIPRYVNSAVKNKKLPGIMRKERHLLGEDFVHSNSSSLNTCQAAAAAATVQQKNDDDTDKFSMRLGFFKTPRRKGENASLLPYEISPIASLTDRHKLKEGIAKTPSFRGVPFQKKETPLVMKKQQFQLRQF